MKCRMRIGTFCSGIGSPELAARSLGWEPAWCSEIDPFASAVHAARFPGCPNLGDMTKLHGGDLERVDVVFAGTPCQSFSVAGLRAGMADPRGNLALVLLGLVDQLRPEWLVWENVPGVLSSTSGEPESAPPSRVGVGHGEQFVETCEYNEADDFRCFTSALTELGYGWAYRVLDAQYVRVDGHEHAVPQRRNRVFVVGHLGDWRRAAAVLFERNCLSGNPAPRREAGARIARSIKGGTRGGGGQSSIDGQETLIACNNFGTRDTATAISTKNERLDGDTETFVVHSLRGEGFDASEDGTGRGTPIVPIPFDTTQITSHGNYSNPKPGDPMHPLAAGAHAPAIAFHPTQDPISSTDGTTQCMGTGSKQGSATVAIAFQTRIGRNGRGQPKPIIDALTSCEGGTHADSKPHVAGSFGVRRLTPLECERCQGFPDDWTLIDYKGKPAKDSPRYRSVGNSIAVNCSRWVLERIGMVNEVRGAA